MSKDDLESLSKWYDQDVCTIHRAGMTLLTPNQCAQPSELAPAGILKTYYLRNLTFNGS